MRERKKKKERKGERAHPRALLKNERRDSGCSSFRWCCRYHRQLLVLLVPLQIYIAVATLVSREEKEESRKEKMAIPFVPENEQEAQGQQLEQLMLALYMALQQVLRSRSARYSSRNPGVPFNTIRDRNGGITGQEKRILLCDNLPSQR